MWCSWTDSGGWEKLLLEDLEMIREDKWSIKKTSSKLETHNHCILLKLDLLKCESVCVFIMQISIYNMKMNLHFSRHRLPRDWLIKNVKSKWSITIIFFPGDFMCSWALSRCFNWTRVFLVLNAVWIIKIINATQRFFGFIKESLRLERTSWDHLVHLAFEHLHRCWVHSVSGQFFPVFVQLERKEVFSWVQLVSP